MKSKIEFIINNLIFYDDLKIKLTHLIIDAIFYYSNIVSFEILIIALKE